MHTCSRRGSADSTFAPPKAVVRRCKSSCMKCLLCHCDQVPHGKGKAHAPSKVWQHSCHMSQPRLLSIRWPCKPDFDLCLCGHIWPMAMKPQVAQLVGKRGQTGIAYTGQTCSAYRCPEWRIRHGAQCPGIGLAKQTRQG